ncbi:MAG: enolase C-terminal domain-like protein [Deinococcales bacterium]
MALGFTAIKFDPVTPYSAFDPRQLSLEALDRGERYVKQVREAVGDKADLLLGRMGKMTPAGAVRLARRLEPYDPLWPKNPPPENAEDKGQSRQANHHPYCHRAKDSAANMILSKYQHQAAAILQMNLGRVGGILEPKNRHAVEAHYVQIAPHL